ncbi:hypothetical protein T4E_7126 [Trichinella pseudospiralis]|uniref:Uncharacterized protein n=1 Tax=Trichinella pseudospiralis TaxID=6337 RepID=A0A0V0Y0L5_TRIPS|nr:hypothetical protein T4E_7126 [Trichinella pseudospiralis]
MIWKRNFRRLSTLYDRMIYLVEPDLNFDMYFNDLSATKRLLECRGIMPNVNLNALRSDYFNWKQLKCEQEKLQNLHTCLMKLCTERNDEKSENGCTSDEFIRLQDCITQLKSINKEISRTEKVIETCLALPNDLDVETPIGNEEKQLLKYEGKFLKQCEHENLLQRKGWLFSKNAPYQCFLSGRAAIALDLLEQFVTSVFSNAKLTFISPSYFVRTPVLEACLMSINDFLQIEEKEYGAYDSAVTLNVVGHSLLAYLCLFTRRAVPSNVCLPLKLYSFGNSYKNNKKNSEKPNSVLLQCNQSRVLTAFALTDSSESVSIIMKEISEQIVNIFKSLDIDYACYRQPSKKLLPSQRSSISFRIQTCASQSEHDTATVSDYGTFLSRRLRIMTEDKNYLHCVYSEINIFCLLASFIERWWSEQDQSTLPPQNASRM